MNQDLLARFGDPVERVERERLSIRNGQRVIVTDDEQQENEDDIIFTAETLTSLQMNMLIRTSTGIVCLCLTPEKIETLALPMMVQENRSRFGTAFTVSFDAARGITTGVSAADRVTTVRAAIADWARPEDLDRPGHIFPLRTVPDGVLERRGHTEALWSTL